jgi:hypothetical protein
MKKKASTLKKQIGKKNFYAIWAAIIILAVVQTGIIINLLDIHQFDRDISAFKLGSSIASFEEKIYKNPVIDIVQNRVYIPEARIYFPLNETSRDLRYNYVTISQYPELRLSMPGAIGHQQPKDSPTCDRVVALESMKESPSSEFEFVGDLSSNIGNLHYIYKHQPCSIYGKDLADSLADVAKEARQY